MIYEAGTKFTIGNSSPINHKILHCRLSRTEACESRLNSIDYATLTSGVSVSVLSPIYERRPKFKCQDYLCKNMSIDMPVLDFPRPPLLSNRRSCRPQILRLHRPCTAPDHQTPLPPAPLPPHTLPRLPPEPQQAQAQAQSDLAPD